MTAQTEIALDTLKLSEGAWLINRIDVNYEARALEITADYDEGREFRLVFKDFHLLSWQILEDERDPGRVNADVIGMDFGEHEGRPSAVIAADLFEIIVSYGELEIVKAW